MILCLGTTPALQRTMVFGKLAIDGVNRAHSTVDGIAGKSVNVAKVLQALGANPFAMGFLGGERGEQLKRELDARRIGNEFIRVPQPTRQCVTVIDEGEEAQTELVEESRRVSPRAYKGLLSATRRRSRHCEAIVMSGTLTPGAPSDFYLKCARIGREAGALVIVDAKGEPLIAALNAGLDVVKPNRSELETTFGKRLKTERDMKAAMRRLCDGGARNIVVTNGSRPAVAFDGVDFWRIYSPPVEAVNPIGSGDSFTAGLVWRLVKGESFTEACRWGAACGAANALTLMAGELTLRTVQRLWRDTRIQRW